MTQTVKPAKPNFMDAATKYTDLPSLYQATAARIFRYHFARLQNLQEAEDLTSQTFVAAWENWSSLRDPSKAVAWLFTIARNKLNDHFRKQNHLLHMELDDELAQNTYNNDPNNTQLSDALLDLHQQIMQFPEGDQELIRLRLVGELPFKTLSQILKEPQMRIKKRYYRLLERLQAQQERT